MRKKFECTKSECTKIVRKSEIDRNFFFNVRKIGMHKTDTKIEQILKMCEKLNGFEKCTNKCCQCLGLISLIEKSQQQQNIEHKDLDKKIILEIKKKFGNSENPKFRNPETKFGNSETNSENRKFRNPEMNSEIE